MDCDFDFDFGIDSNYCKQNNNVSDSEKDIFLNWSKDFKFLFKYQINNTKTYEEFNNSIKIYVPNESILDEILNFKWRIEKCILNDNEIDKILKYIWNNTLNCEIKKYYENILNNVSYTIQNNFNKVIQDNKIKEKINLREIRKKTSSTNYKRLKNNISAKNCRIKKKKYIESLENKINYYENKIKIQDNIISNLKQFIKLHEINNDNNNVNNNDNNNNLKWNFNINKNTYDSYIYKEYFSIDPILEYNYM